MNQATKEQVMDCMLEYNVPPSNYFECWEEFSTWQFEFLRNQGLEATDKLLDIGCGALRGGIKFIEFLDSGNYTGVDAYKPYVDAAGKIVDLFGINKKWKVIHSQNFDFPNERFDYLIAQSVLTHLSLKQWCDLQSKLSNYTKPGSKLYFTYSYGIGKTLGFMYGGTAVMQMPAIENREVLAKIATDHNAEFRELKASPKHPTGQQVGVYIYK